MYGPKDCAVSRALLASGMAATALSLVLAARRPEPEAPRVIEVVADHDSRFRMPGEKEPVITVRAGEALTLRITAIKAKSHNRDGSIHGFALLHAKDRSKVPGWDFLLKPGVQEFPVTAPAEPGEYVVVCTVICSDDHEGMHMRFVVEP
jgi:heme/copper-type cytochrome/quinol oxidase subunit 2